MSEKIKLIFPIHPIESDEQIEKNLSNFLNNLNSKVDLEIEPVSVMSSNFFTTSEYFEPIDTKMLKEHLHDECRAYLEKFPGLNFSDLKILENNYSSQSAEVYCFSEYVRKSDADFVVMCSHGRRGWARAFLGSFTENFLLKSRIPVFVLGPHYKTQSTVSSALMPVELSESSQKFLEVFLDHHGLAFLDKLKLYHKISMVDIEDIAWAPTLYGLGGVGPVNIMEKAKEASHEYLKRFLEHPLSEKRLSLEVSEDLNGLSSVICDRVKEKDVDLLVMRSESGTFAANVLGSVTRQVIRGAEVPVVVYPFTCQKIK